MPEVGLSATGLQLWRGDRCLFSDLDLVVRPGEVLHVVGANGTGKTTLLRVLCGLTLADEGTVYWEGRPLHKVRQDFHAQLAYIGHRDGLKGDLSGEENIRFDLGLRRPVGPEQIREGLDTLGVAACAGLPTRHLSAGQKRRTALTRTLLSGASLWVLDEPMTNLDAQGRGLILELVGQHLDKGGMMVVAAHHELELAHHSVTELRLG